MLSLTWLRCFVFMASWYISWKNQGAVGKTTDQYRNTCEKCICYDDQSRIYNLLPLQKEDDEHPSYEVTSKLGYTYSYSPCRPFKLKSPCKDDVAICRRTDEYFEKIGEVDRLKWGYDSKSRSPLLTYESTTGRYHDNTEWYPKVRLVCDSTVNNKEAKFEMIGDDQEKSWTFNLTHNCACPNGCLPEDSRPFALPLSVAGAFVAVVLLSITICWCRRQKNNNPMEHDIAAADNRNYGSMNNFFGQDERKKNINAQRPVSPPVSIGRRLSCDTTVLNKNDCNNANKDTASI